MSLKRGLARFLLLRAWGWRIVGQLPHDTPKCLVIVYPHTTNWDFPIGILVRNAFSIEINFAAKDSLFKPPFGWIFSWLGGKPVVRSRKTKFVDAVADIFRREEVFRLAFTPEGTRKRVDDLKTGFHHIARLAGVPLVFCTFDWGTKTLHWSPPYYVDGSYERTLDIFHDTFRGAVGYHPGNAYPIPVPAT